MLKNWLYAFLFAAAFLILCGVLDERDASPPETIERNIKP